MPWCLFLQPTSHRVNLINHQEYICSGVLLTINNKPINHLSDLAVFMQTEKSLIGNTYYLILFKQWFKELIRVVDDHLKQAGN